MVYMMVLIVQAFVGNCVFLISKLFVISNSYCVVLIHCLYPFDNELQCIKQSKLHIEFSFNYWILLFDSYVLFIDSIIYYSIFAYWKSNFQYYSDQTGVFHYVGSKLIKFPSSRINSNIEDDLDSVKQENSVLSEVPFFKPVVRDSTDVIKTIEMNSNVEDISSTTLPDEAEDQLSFSNQRKDLSESKEQEENNDILSEKNDVRNTSVTEERMSDHFKEEETVNVKKDEKQSDKQEEVKGAYSSQSDNQEVIGTDSLENSKSLTSENQIVEKSDEANLQSRLTFPSNRKTLRSSPSEAPRSRYHYNERRVRKKSFSSFLSSYSESFRPRRKSRTGRLPDYPPDHIQDNRIDIFIHDFQRAENKAIHSLADQVYENITQYKSYMRELRQKQTVTSFSHYLVNLEKININKPVENYFHLDNERNQNKQIIKKFKGNKEVQTIYTKYNRMFIYSFYYIYS